MGEESQLEGTNTSVLMVLRHDSAAVVVIAVCNLRNMTEKSLAFMLMDSLFLTQCAAVRNHRDSISAAEQVFQATLAAWLYLSFA